MRILLAEDDTLVGGAVQKVLGRGGFAVDWVCCGLDFKSAIAEHRYDLVVLDLTFPDVRGEQLLTLLHGKSDRIPVIVASAQGGAQDKVRLLSLGADDYLVKPFDLDELTARVQSVLRRASSDEAPTDASVHGPLAMYPQRFVATWYGETVALTHREFWVLDVLLRRKNQVLSRAQIEDALYGWGEEVESNAVEVYVHMLRRKFGAYLINTVRGVGYQIAPVHQLELYVPQADGPVKTAIRYA